jgi:enoyl-CoA hydratase/carnithine racemase
MSDQVRISTDPAGIRKVQLARPEKKNALTQAMYRHLEQALRAADEDPAIRVILLTGSDDSFCSGNDVADFVSQEGANPDAGAAMEFLSTIAALRKPLVAAVNGLAVGIGVTMLLHCDLVYAADTATFTLPFINLGLVPEAASTLLLPQLAGYQRAAELLFFGEPIDAARALAIGLVNAVSPAAQLAEQVAARAAMLAKKPAASMLATKALLRRAPETVPARMQAETAELLRLLQTDETRAIVQNFFSRSQRRS